MVKTAMGNDTTSRLTDVLAKVTAEQKRNNRGFLDWLEDSWASICGSSTSTLVLLAGLGLLYKCVTDKKTNSGHNGAPYSTSTFIGLAPSAPQLPVNMQFLAAQDAEKGLRNIFETKTIQ